MKQKKSPIIVAIATVCFLDLKKNRAIKKVATEATLLFK